MDEGMLVFGVLLQRHFPEGKCHEKFMGNRVTVYEVFLYLLISVTWHFMDVITLTIYY